VCECKDRSVPAQLYCYGKILPGAGFGQIPLRDTVLKKGISGEGTHRDAALEQLKIFQDRGTVIVVVDQRDLDRVADGANFISLLRSNMRGFASI